MLILMITNPWSARAEVEHKKVPAGTKLHLKVFPRANNEALNDVVLPQIRHTGAGRLSRDVR